MKWRFFANCLMNQASRAIVEQFCSDTRNQKWENSESRICHSTK